MGRADLGTKDLLARAGSRWLRVEFAQPRVGLEIGIVVGGRRSALAPQFGSAGRAASSAPALAVPCRGVAPPFARARGGVAPAASPTACGGLVYVVDALGVVTAIALELRLNPVDGSAVAVGSLAAVSKFGQATD